MNKYDKIYVPIGEGQGVYFDVNRKSVVGDKSIVSYPTEPFTLKEQSNQICMTIEELSQLWNAGHSAGMEDAGATLKSPAVDFEAYLQSKGINI